MCVRNECNMFIISLLFISGFIIFFGVLFVLLMATSRFYVSETYAKFYLIFFIPVFSIKISHIEKIYCYDSSDGRKSKGFSLLNRRFFFLDVFPFLVIEYKIFKFFTVKRTLYTFRAHEIYGLILQAQSKIK